MYHETNCTETNISNNVFTITVLSQIISQETIDSVYFSALLKNVRTEVMHMNSVFDEAQPMLNYIHVDHLYLS